MAPPANVPSWWQFNEAVLAQLRDRALTSTAPSAETRAAVEGLTLEQVGVVGFSQVVHDTVAGSEWFQLLRVLDGTTPNDGHIAVARMMASGELSCVLSTNFDSLIEKALRQHGVEFDMLIPTRDAPPSILHPTSKPLLVKLHGSVDAAATMVDLATQKAVGFTDEWRAWLTRLFETSEALVAGFSGSDLEVSDDYLCLFAAANRLPRLRWLSRTGEIEVPAVRRLLDACGDRAEVVIGRLPDFLTTRAQASLAGTGGSPVPAPAVEELPLEQIVIDWFSPSPKLLSAVTVGRLLALADREGEATLLRTAIRDELGDVPTSLTVESALWRAMIKAGLGLDGATTEPDIAEKDIYEALSLHNAVAGEEDSIDMSEAGWEQWRASRLDITVGLLCALSFALLRLGRMRDSERVSLQILQLISSLGPGSTALSRAAMAFAGMGDQSAVRRKFRDSAWSYRISSELYKMAGEHRGATRSRRGWAQAAWYLRERSLALKICEDYAPSNANSGVDADIVRLLKRIAKEWRWPMGRFDEVVYSIVASGEARSRWSTLTSEWMRALAASSRPGEVSQALLLAALLTLLEPDADLALPNPEQFVLDAREVLVHPDLEAPLRLIGLELIREGFNKQRRDSPDFPAAAWAFATAARAFELARDEEARFECLIYVVDATRSSDLDQARSLLAGLLELVPLPLLPMALERHVSMLVRSVADANDGDRAAAELEVARIRREMPLGVGVEAAIVALEHARILLMSRRERDAHNAADEALAMSKGQPHEDMVREAHKSYP